MFYDVTPSRVCELKYTVLKMILGTCRVTPSRVCELKLKALLRALQRLCHTLTGV